METIAEQKKRLRKALRAQAAALPKGYLVQSDEKIEQALLATNEWQHAQTVFIYVSVGAEPATRRLIEHAWQQGKRVCVPRCGPNGVMWAHCIEAFSELASGAYHLPEPSPASPQVQPGEINLIVAPCVAADRHGMRLGNGGGFYDRYLPQTQAPVLCLCRGLLLQQYLPAEATDRPVTRVITEDGLWPKE